MGLRGQVPPCRNCSLLAMRYNRIHHFAPIRNDNWSPITMTGQLAHPGKIPLLILFVQFAGYRGAPFSDRIGSHGKGFTLPPHVTPRVF